MTVVTITNNETSHGVVEVKRRHSHGPEALEATLLAGQSFSILVYGGLAPVMKEVTLAQAVADGEAAQRKAEGG